MWRSWWITVIAVLAVPAMCFAWRGKGHELVALIADEHLTRRAKAAVSDYSSPATPCHKARWFRYDPTGRSKGIWQRAGD